MEKLQRVISIILYEKRKRGKGISRLIGKFYRDLVVPYFMMFTHTIHPINFLISDHVHSLGIVRNRLTIALRMKMACSLQSSRNRVEIFDC